MDRRWIQYIQTIIKHQVNKWIKPTGNLQIEARYHSRFLNHPFIDGI